MAFLAPRSVPEAVAMLAQNAPARCLAGGASLVGQLNAGTLPAPSLVNLAQIPGLRMARRDADGSVTIGAMVRHVELANADMLHNGHGLLAKAAAAIGSPAIRNMGTIGGALALGALGADYPPALLALDAQVHISGPGGECNVGIANFLAARAQHLGPGDIITALYLPPVAEATIAAYRKFTRLHGDFAIVSIALVVGLDGSRINSVACAVGGCGPRPVRVAAAEALLCGGRPDATTVAHAGSLLAAECDAFSDVRASAAYRAALVPRLLADALAGLLA